MAHTRLLHRAFGHVNPQPARFADNAWHDPGQIGLPHRMDEIADVFGNCPASGPTMPTQAPLEDYLRRVKQAADVLVEQGYLLAEDLPTVAAQASQRHDLFRRRVSIEHA